MDDVRRTVAAWAIAARAVFTTVSEADAQVDLATWLRGESSHQVAASHHPNQWAGHQPVARRPQGGQSRAVSYENTNSGRMANEIVFDSVAEGPVSEGEVVATGWHHGRGSGCGGGCAAPCGSACGPVVDSGCGVTCGVGCGMGCGGCGPCNAPQGPMGLECGGDGRGPCGGYPTMPPYWAHTVGGGFFRDLSLHAGVHGFKGPADLGRNGNFGLHEGFNFAGPFGGPAGFGYQFGMNIVHSNFHGNQQLNQDNNNDRDQVFFTGGVFRRRPCGGWQWGAAIDLLHDSYYETINMTQVRSETSYVFAGGVREIGYFGMYGTGNERLDRVRYLQVEFEPTDLFAFFYRRHFSGGGNGRVWMGFSGQGDGLVGGDLHVPLGEGRWSLVNRFNYLIPKDAHNVNGLPEESWGVTIQLVWYPGQPARLAEKSQFRAMFDPADNTLFLVDRNVN